MMPKPENKNNVLQFIKLTHFLILVKSLTRLEKRRKTNL